jgi:prepilin-type N-terminal cleavage/methylation domain-containing protein
MPARAGILFLRKGRDGKLVPVRDSRGFTLIELLLVMLILGIVLTVALANYRQGRLRGSEASAIGALAAINQAQFAYMQTCGNQKFAPKLTTLGKPNPGTGAAYLSPDLTGADEIVKSGYRILMEGAEVLEPVQTCTGETPVESYHVTADPLVPGTTGDRYFGTNVDRVIYEGFETFSSKMPDTGAPPHGQEIRGAAR